MARDSRNRTGSDDSDTDDVSGDVQSTGDGVVDIDMVDGVLIDRDTGEPIDIDEEPFAPELLPDYLWVQHSQGSDNT